ncbi:ATP-grasp domain-containing protein, partial [Candidatus Woesearchaeota archaeon]|nr:ATP-grasp domain-containing protein [Candidatus Woesearchaeota archaeon]
AAKELLKDVKFPVILKFPQGTQGKGVLFVESFAAAASTLDALSVLNQPVIIQDYIETGGVDLRVIVTGDKVAAAMKRIAVFGEKRANIHAGGKGEAFIPDERTKRVALNTAKAIGADICAVDMLESVKGPVVIEVNLSPGLQGITKATGINVAEKLASYMHDRTREYIAQKKASVKTADILKDVGVAAAEDGRINEIIGNLDLRGQRLLLPETVSKMTKFTDKGEYIIKFKDGELCIKRMKAWKK